MEICYLLETTDLWGGVRIVFDQARALQKLGCQVRIRALGGDHRWYPHPIDIDYVGDLALPFSDPKSAPEVVVATFWRTVESAVRLKRSSAFHLCQGYEGDYEEYLNMRPAIESAYRLQIPKITIAEWLSDLLRERFGAGAFPIFCVGQIVDLELFRPLPFPKRVLSRLGKRKTTVLLVGHFDVSFKGIRDGLNAVRLMREKGYDINLIRVSPVDSYSKEAAITHPDEYHVHVSPARLVRIYQRSDLFLSPSLAQEGFGLPFAEALGCGIPSVATAIPSYLGLDRAHDYACFVPERDPEAMAKAAMAIIDGDIPGRRLGKRGVEVVNDKFRGELVAARLTEIFSKALS